MSNNLRRYRAIYQALTQGHPGEPNGNTPRRLSTLAAFNGLAEGDVIGPAG